MKAIQYTMAACMLASSPAMAGDFFFKPYVGASYDYVHANYQDDGDQIAEENLHGFDIHAGARIHKYFGIEGSYLWTADGTKDNVLGTGINTKVNVMGYALDAMGYLPVTDKTELIGTAGVSRLRAHGRLEAGGAAAALSQWETKGRIGGGAQYWLTDNLNIRGLVRYQAADFSDTLDNAIIASLGLNWQF
jgi:hypothetical protein